MVEQVIPDLGVMILPPSLKLNVLSAVALGMLLSRLCVPIAKGGEAYAHNNHSILDLRLHDVDEKELRLVEISSTRTRVEIQEADIATLAETLHRQFKNVKILYKGYLGNYDQINTIYELPQNSLVVATTIEGVSHLSQAIDEAEYRFRMELKNEGTVHYRRPSLQALSNFEKTTIPSTVLFKIESNDELLGYVTKKLNLGNGHSRHRLGLPKWLANGNPMQGQELNQERKKINQRNSIRLEQDLKLEKQLAKQQRIDSLIGKLDQMVPIDRWTKSIRNIQKWRRATPKRTKR